MQWLVEHCDCTFKSLCLVKTIYRFGNGGGGPEGGLPGSAGGGPAGGREGGMGGGAPRLGGGGILEGVPGATGVLAPPVGVEVPDDCCDDPRRISAGLYNKTQYKNAFCS